MKESNNKTKETKTMNKISKKTAIARIVAMILVILMVFGMMSVAFTGYASSSPVTADNREVLPKQEIFFQNKRVEAGKKMEIQAGGILLVEKDAVLTIHGSLVNYGTLKNEGTILITNADALRGVQDVDTGYLSNQGVIENKGKIRVINGSIDNHARAEFKNQGELLLESDKQGGTLFHNMSRPANDKTFGALLTNTGTITIFEGVQRGVVNYKHSVLENEGILQLTQAEQLVGDVTGNIPEIKQ